MSEIPRRARIDLAIPAEAAIRAAIAEVEKLGAHPGLTNIVVKLGEALDETADWYDGGAPGAYPATNAKTNAPTPEQIDALAFELYSLGIHVPPRDTAFFQAAVRKWLAGAGLNNRWQDMATFPSDQDDLVWLCKGNAVDGPRAPQIDDPDIYEWWCSAEPPALPTT